MKNTTEIALIIQGYIAENGPTEAARISRDTGIPEPDIAAAAAKWEARGRLDGPGKNYVAG